MDLSKVCSESREILVFRAFFESQNSAGKYIKSYPIPIKFWILVAFIGWFHIKKISSKNCIFFLSKIVFQHFGKCTDFPGFFLRAGKGNTMRRSCFWSQKPSPSVTFGSDRVTSSSSQDLKYLIVL